MTEINAEVKAQIEQCASSSYVAWKANATEEQKANGLEQLAKMSSDEEFKNMKLGEISTKFGECDANSDGLLDRDEYMNWLRGMNAIWKAAGNWVDERPESYSACYAAANKVIAGVDGVSLQDCFVVMGVCMAKHTELKAADGL